MSDCICTLRDIHYRCPMHGVNAEPPREAGPTDTQMLDWLAFNVPSIEQFRGEYRLSRLSSQLTGWHNSLRAAIRSAMKEVPRG